MGKQYQWTNSLVIESGGYPGEPHGTTGGVVGWQTADTDDAGQGDASYWYGDSDSQSQSATSNISIVSASIIQSWGASVDTLNNLTIVIATQISALDRTAYGNPGTTSRDIEIRTKSDGQTVFTKNQDAINTTHAIATSPISISSYTLTIPPGSEAQTSSLYYINHAHGYPWEEQYTDILGMGVRFKNILPTAPTYTLHYDANGGTGAPGDQSTQTNVGSATFTVSSTQPTWGQYIFLGWSTQQIDQGKPSDVEYRAGDSLTISGASSTTVTLYAVWQKDYRPGERKISGTWMSHNRTVGKCERKVSGTWTELRTINGGVGTDNPPSRKVSGTWYNQKLIGQE